MRNNKVRATWESRITGLLLALLLVAALSAPGYAYDYGESEEESPGYTDIAFGAEGDDVLALQTRLKELGYYSEENALTPSVFDNGTEQAVRLFCEYNSIAYSGSGASAPVQHIIFSEGAVPYEAPEVKLSAAEKLTAYMTRQVPVFGSHLPMYFLWICSVVILVLILVLCVYFFVPNREKLARKEAEKGAVPQYWRKKMANTDSAGLYAREKLSGSGNLLDFQVHYNGNVTNVQAVCKPRLVIGRGGDCGIVLNGADTSASHRHCELYYRGAVLMLRDVSSNGTQVNGRWINGAECRVNPGDQITIGAHLLVIQF